MAKKRRKVVRKHKIRSIALHIPVLPRIKLNHLALGYSFAILGAASRLILAVLAKMGIGLEAFTLVQKFHLTYSTDIAGIIGGMSEAALMGLIVGAVIGWVYNRVG